MIHVLHVISGLGRGGAEAMLLRLVRGLDRQTFTQSVVSLTDHGVYGEAVEAEGVRLTAMGLRGMLSAPGCCIRLRRHIQNEQPAIIQTWLYHADLLGLLAAWPTTTSRLVWNIRCATLRPGDVPRSTLALIALLARLSATPEAIVFNSHAGMNAHYASGYRPQNSRVIPNGFDIETWRPRPSERHRIRNDSGISDDDFLVGMVARYHKLKDHKTFLESMSRLAVKYTNIRFLLAGPGIDWDNEELVEQVTRANLKTRVVLLGPRSDIHNVMPGLDCLVSTSISEGFPNVLGEAMSCGVPCIATDAGDSRYIVGDAGWIVPVGDANAVASAVGELLEASPAEREQRSRRCRTTIATTFEISRVVEQYADLYKDLYARQKQ